MAYQSRKKQKQKDFKVRFRVWGFLALIVALFAAVYYFSRYEPWMFTEISFEGNNRVEIAQVEEDIWQELESPWYVLFAQNNKLFFPKTRIEKTLLTKHTLIKSLELSLEGDQTILVRITERGPQYIVCSQEYLEVEISDECSFVDYIGLAYEKYDPSVVSNALPVYVEKQRDVLPSNPFSESGVAYLRSIQDIFEGLPLQKIIFTPGESTDVYITEEFHIKVTELRPLDEQIQNIEIALGQSFNTIPLNTYEYIDVRFKGKMYAREQIEKPVLETEEEVKEIEEAEGDPENSVEDLPEEA